VKNENTFQTYRLILLDHLDNFEEQGRVGQRLLSVNNQKKVLWEVVCVLALQSILKHVPHSITVCQQSSLAGTVLYIVEGVNCRAQANIRKANHYASANFFRKRVEEQTRGKP
jgi:hypothetical protein